MRSLVLSLREKEMRNRILLTVALIVLYRIGANIPIPSVNYEALNSCFNGISSDSALGLLDVFSGGALLGMSIFALGIMPFITASILMQLLPILIPPLRRMQREGASGQQRLTQYTRYLTVFLAAIEAFGVYRFAIGGLLFPGCQAQIFPSSGLFEGIVVVSTLVAGALILMRFAEIITEKGVGNGTSLIMFVSIAAGLPRQLGAIFGTAGAWIFAAILILIFIAAFGVVSVERAVRKIPVFYSNQIPGLSGGSRITDHSYLPVRLNIATIIPLIIASSALTLPVLYAEMRPGDSSLETWILTNLQPGLNSWYLIAHTVLVAMFAYFYATVAFDSEIISQTLQENGGVIPDVRPGAATRTFLEKLTNRLSGFSSVYLIVFSTLPIIVLGSLGLDRSTAVTGATLLILIGVGMDTLRQTLAKVRQYQYSSLWEEQVK